MRKLLLIAVVAAFAAVPTVSALASAPTKVTVGNDFFKAKRLTIKRGTRVTWVWQSFGILHNVSVKSGPSKFHSRNKGSGTYTHLFAKKGTYHLYCSLHPTLMKETIIVR